MWNCEDAYSKLVEVDTVAVESLSKASQKSLKSRSKASQKIVSWPRQTDRQCQLLRCPGQLKSYSYHPSSLMNPSLYILQILFLRFERNTLSPILVQCQAPGRCWFYKKEIWFRGQNKSKFHFPQFWCSSSRKNLPSQAFLASLWWVQVKIVLTVVT